MIAPDANIEVAARRIIWGKLLNSGQTCIAPDYVLCPADKEEKLVQACKKAAIEFYGEASPFPTAEEPLYNPISLLYPRTPSRVRITGGSSTPCISSA